MEVAGIVDIDLLNRYWSLLRTYRLQLILKKKRESQTGELSNEIEQLVNKDTIRIMRALFDLQIKSNNHSSALFILNQAHEILCDLLHELGFFKHQLDKTFILNLLP